MALGQIQEMGASLGQGLWNAASGMVGVKNKYANLGGQSLGIMESFHQGGFVGAYDRFNAYFGRGYDIKGASPASGRAIQTIKGMSEARAGFSGLLEGPRGLRTGFKKGMVSSQDPGFRAALRGMRETSLGARTTFRTRAGVYGAGAAAGLALGGATVGFGSMAVGGGFYLGGSLAGRALGATSVFGGNVAAGSRIGGRVGLGIYGGYRAGKWAGRKLGMW